MNDKHKVSDWQAINKVTGEVMELDVLQVKEGGSWNKVFIKEFAYMIGLAGSGASKVLGVMLEQKNAKNEMHGTQREIAEMAGVSVSLVNKTFKALIDGGCLRQIRCGSYIFNPNVITYGNAGNRIAILRVWVGLTAE